MNRPDVYHLDVHETVQVSVLHMYLHRACSRLLVSSIGRGSIHNRGTEYSLTSVLYVEGSWGRYARTVLLGRFLLRAAVGLTSTVLGRWRRNIDVLVFTCIQCEGDGALSRRQKDHSKSMKQLDE